MHTLLHHSASNEISHERKRSPSLVRSPTLRHKKVNCEVNGDLEGFKTFIPGTISTMLDRMFSKIKLK